MALWLVRAGANGEYEKKFLNENKLYLTWDNLSHDLAALKSRDQLRALLSKVYPDDPKGRIRNFLGQIWAFNHKIDKDVPRTNFDQDLLYSFGAFMSICQVRRNNAEQRIHNMAKNEWKLSRIIPNKKEQSKEDESETGESLGDLDQAARDQIGKLIIARFQGHGMAKLVDAVLRARGYSTFLSPEGPDRGIDILAAPEPMGFGEPRICVQVKSGDSPLDRPTLDQLVGVMANVNATHGLLVSWGGFKSSVDREKATQFFRVRLWDQWDLIGQILAYYDKLDEEIKTRLPLKRIWVVTEAIE